MENDYDVYPPYDKVLKAKKNCYSAENLMTITDTRAEIKLQCLLDHTSRRLVQEMHGDQFLEFRFPKVIFSKCVDCY